MEEEKIRKLLKEELKIKISKSEGDFLRPDKIKVEIKLKDSVISESAVPIAEIDGK